MNHRKQVEKGFYDVNESGKFPRKTLYGSKENEGGCGVDELEGISELVISPVDNTTSKLVKTYGTHLHVPTSNSISTPERVPDVRKVPRKLERPLKRQARIPAKTNLFMKAINNQLTSDPQTPERDVAKAALHTPPNPMIAEASSRTIRTEKQPNPCKANILGTPCMASLAKIGITAKTPAIKVYYDPDGLESAVKKQKSKSTIKKPKRLASKVDDKLGTPKPTRTRAKEKVTLDEDSSDEIELVSSQFKRLLAQKEQSSNDGNFKKPTFEDSSAVETESQSLEEVVSPFRKVIGQSASSNRKLFDETVDLTNETISAEPRSLKTGDTSAAVNSADQSDLDASTVVAPYRKILAKNDRSKGKRVIHDETLDQDEIQPLAKMSEPIKINRNKTKEESQDKPAVQNKGGVEPKTRTVAKGPKSGVAEVGKPGGSKVAAKFELGEKTKKSPLKISRGATRATSRTVAAGSSSAAAQPARGAKSRPKEAESGMLKQPPETDCENRETPCPSSRGKSPSVDEDVGVVSKPVAATKKASKAALLKSASSATARPKRGARAAEPQPGSKLSADTTIPAKTFLKVPSPNVRRNSPEPENVDPNCSTLSSVIDSSVIESSFVERTSELNLPLAPRYLTEEMNKLTISSKPSKQSSSTSVRVTRRNVKK